MMTSEQFEILISQQSVSLFLNNSLRSSVLQTGRGLLDDLRAGGLAG